MKEFTWHCGASSLVDDNYIKFDVKATTIDDAFWKAYKYAHNNNVIDTGTLDINMDLKELAIELGNMASEDDEEWTPNMLLEELESIKDKRELICTLEWIVSNANKGR